MQSPWGEIQVSDGHVHFFSHRFFETLAGQRRGLSVEALGPILGWEMPPIHPDQLAERWVAELDRHGVERAVMIASVPGDEGSAAAAVAFAPGRFIGYFLIDPTAQDAVNRVERAFVSGRLNGICLFPAMHRYSIQDERAVRIIQMASERPGTVIFVHCGVLTVGVRKKLGLPNDFDLKFSNPIDVHLVAQQFPQVNFVIPHFGAGNLREALMLADTCPNVHLDTSSSNRWIRYLETDMDLKDVFRKALAVAGPGRLIFGSDSSFFPRGWHAKIYESQVAILKELGVSGADARKIFGENLLRIHGLDAGAASAARS